MFALLVCFFPTGSVHRQLLDLSQISSPGYNDCHYRDDARSNGPKKIGKSVFSPTSLTEGLRPRPTWHASSVQKKTFSQLIPHVTDKTIVGERQICLVSKVKPKNELIKQIHKQIIPPRSNESKTRGPFRSQVIDGAQRRRRIGAEQFEIPVTRARIRS